MRISVLFLVFLLVVSMNLASEFPADNHSRYSIFGIDIEDFQHAVAGRRSPPEWKLHNGAAIVNFTFDSEPEVVMAYQGDCIARVDWVIFDPGTDPAMTLPAGTYDILVAWYPQGAVCHHIVIREGLVLSAGNHEFVIHETEAQYNLETRPIDSSGSSIPVNSARVVRALRRTGCGLPVYRAEGTFRSNNPNTTRAGVFSALSNGYSYETHFLVYADENHRNKPAYSYCASFRGGIDSEVIMTTDPDLWHEVIIRHYPEPWRDHLLLKDFVANHPFADIPDDHQGLSRVAFCSETSNDDNFPPPFEQKFFVYPNSDPDATVGFFRMSAHDGEHCTSSGKILYRMPLIGWDDGIKGFLRGSSEPVYVPNSNSKVFHTGLGPYFWFARLDYEDDKIRITPSMGLDLLPFLGQTGTRPDSGWPASYLHYELHRGDTLVESDFLSYVESDSELVIPVEQPGEHTLVATFEPYWMDHIHGRSIATVRLAVDTDDPNPPYLTHFAVKADGEPVAHLMIPGGTVEFVAFDDSGIVTATAWYESFTGPRELAVESVGGGKYLIDLVDDLFAGGQTELTTRIEDNSGNYLELSLFFPVSMRMSPNDQFHTE